MICPQTKAECGCQSLLTCTLSSRDPSRSYLDVVTLPPTLAELVSVREDGSLVIDPSVTSFSAQPSSDGWTMEQVSLSNGDVVECGPLVGKTLVDVPGDVAPFVMRDLTKPTLAEIEGLVNTFEQQTINCYMHGLGNHAEWKAARAALMAAIRAYGRE